MQSISGQGIAFSSEESTITIRTMTKKKNPKTLKNFKNNNWLIFATVGLAVLAGFVIYNALAATADFPIKKTISAPNPPKYSVTKSVISTGSSTRNVCVWGNTQGANFNVSVWANGKKISSKTFDWYDKAYSFTCPNTRFSFDYVKKGTRIDFKILVGTGKAYFGSLKATY